MERQLGTKRKFDSARRCNNRQQPYTRAAEGASPAPRVPEKSTNTLESADSLLSHVEITDDYDLKDHNDGNHFLACEIDSRVAARTCMHLERKTQGSAASKVQLEAQHAQLTRPTHVQWIPTPCIVAIKIT